MGKTTFNKLPWIQTLSFFLFVILGHAQGQQTFNTSGSFTVPTGITSITIETWGAGGKGGTRTTNGGSGGGGGGAYARKTMTVTPGTAYTVTVGAGSTSNADGGDSWFNNLTTVLAKGGRSVTENNSSGAAGGDATSCVGDFAFSGGNGANASASKSGGGGGSSAGNNTKGVNSLNASGAIAPIGGGNGGNARSVNDGNGTIGSSPGGGGGGAYRVSSGTRNGGFGANGRVVVTWGPREIDVQGNNISIVSGDLTPDGTDGTDFNSLDISSGAISKTFKILNLGSDILTVNSILLTGASDFTITNSATFPASISGMNSISITISFDPVTIGNKEATVSISNNDSNENPYTFKIKGIGIQTFYDSDGDGIFDNIDIDDDNDGILDITEEKNCRDSNGYNVNYKFLNETFGSGTERTTINTTYAATTSYLYENGGDLNDGEYTVGPSALIASWATGPSGIWYRGGDHTGDANGRMAMFNADYTPGIFYTALITGALPQTPITYSFWVINLDRSDAGGIATRLRPNIKVEFRDLSDNILATISTGQIAPTSASNASGDWYNFKADLIFNVSAFKVIFINNETGGLGNDLAIDDISITQTLCDRDGDGIADLFDLDADNDGIEDIIEVGLGALTNGKGKIDVSWVDDNKNGLHDSAESNAALAPIDSDGDGTPNYIDLDSDNDSIFDVDESGAGNTNAVSGFVNGDGDINGDGVGNGPESEAFRFKDINGDGTPELFGDGILDIFDYGTGINQYGNLNQGVATANAATTFLKDTDGDGIPDYLDTKSDGINFDITNNKLIYDYKVLDANNDGIIDGSTDIDKDGILDIFDTNTSYFGSPRDLHTKLLLDFDGRNDYGQSTAILGGLSSATLMAWIDMNSLFTSDGVILGQDKFILKINSAKKLEATVNGTTLTYGVELSTKRWYHVAAVYGGGNLKLYLNGKEVANQVLSGNIEADTSLLTIGKNPLSNTGYFKGKMDEVRVFNVALSEAHLQRMVYQEVENFSSEIRGSIVPKNIASTPNSLPFANLLRYYRMDVYKDDVIDDLTTSASDLTGARIYNHKNIYLQQAPMPFLTERSGRFAEAVDSPSKEIRGEDIMEQDWSIVKVSHNITETANNIDLGMIVDPEILINMTNDTKIQNDWYLKLDGKIDLTGMSQLVQSTESDLDVLSLGSIERDQQGQSNKYNYNYWSSPVSIINNNANNKDYNLSSIMMDGTDATTPKPISWVGGYDGSSGNPIKLARYWVYKFDNYSNAYANWAGIGETGNIRVGQGYTMKGSGASTALQNYTFIGKPNNGVIKTNSVGPNQLLLAGNPYPSALNAAAFINDNIAVAGTDTSDAISGTLYFWEHYSTNNTHILKDYQGGYATRNLTGGTVPSSSNVNFISKSGTPSKGIPSQYIPVGQGFFIIGRANSTVSTVIFKNSQRAFVKEDTIASNTLYKLKSGKTVKWDNNYNDPIAKDTIKRIRLGLNSRNDYHKQILLGFMNEKATDSIDYGYDGTSFDKLPNDIYFLAGKNKLIIQGVGHFDTNASYPIGVKTDSIGKVKFVIDELENFEKNQAVYIYDNETDIYHEISKAPFEIILPEGENKTRFSLRFLDKNKVIKEDTEAAGADNELALSYQKNGNTLTLHNRQEDIIISKITLFNILGQSISNWDISNEDQNNIQLPIKKVSTGIYIAKIQTSKGDISKKIIIR
ncbi:MULTISPECIES: LamG-like jellyroll fold domain-containing protein [unclassified Flavobacterium]|uniref:LamG-like jellyroll fold domain-containing protein n=1 Tax=unclassified Flavobacterium TaxID=196869 RepID=UPI003F9059E6